MGKQNWRVRASQPVVKLVCGYPVVPHRIMFYVCNMTLFAYYDVNTKIGGP